MSATVEAFLAAKRLRGLAPSSVESIEDRLRMVLGPVWTRSLRSIADRGEELYAAAHVYPAEHRRAGELRAPDTHLNALAVCKDWGAWVRKQKWIGRSPFADVEPVGRKIVGADKLRHTVDEARRLQATCHAIGARDPGAVITLGYLLLGERATELVTCSVRDLDDGGRLLWVRGTKSAPARRRLLVPDELVPLLLAHAAGRPGEEPLFLAEASGRWPAGRPWTRHMAYLHVRRLCGLAGVPELGPQGLRRTQATLAEDAGETAIAVARHLGHTVGAAPAVTHRSYVSRDSARAAVVQRGLRVLQGGRR